MTEKLYLSFSRVVCGLCTEIAEPQFSPILGGTKHFALGEIVLLTLNGFLL